MFLVVVVLEVVLIQAARMWMLLVLLVLEVVLGGSVRRSLTTIRV